MVQLCSVAVASVLAFSHCVSGLHLGQGVRGVKNIGESIMGGGGGAGGLVVFRVLCHPV